MAYAPAHILLVEDDDGDALLVGECLREAGFPGEALRRERTVSAAAQALERDPMCVLLDLGLPDAHGLSALHHLVRTAPGMPVIVLTGRHDGAGDEAVAAGAQDYLVKDDITPELLDRSIRYARERKRAQRAELRLRAERFQAAENDRLERGLLPTPLLRSDRIECQTFYRPGSDLAVLGGDFYDVVETSDGRLRAVIGDVMGHGPDEAALGVHLRVAWRTLVLSGAPDQHVLTVLSSVLASEERGGTFVTLCDVTVEPDYRMSVRIAGHPAPLLQESGRARYLRGEVGLPLGITGLPRNGLIGNSSWPETTAKLEPGASLLLYTDGLLDGYRTGAGAGLGIDELVAATEAVVAARPDPAGWLRALVESAPATAADDTAAVVLTRAQS